MSKVSPNQYLVEKKKGSKKSGNLRPSDDVDPKIKETPEWLHPYAEYLYGQFHHGGTYYNARDSLKMFENRLYGFGRQSTSKYHEAIGIKPESASSASSAENGGKSRRAEQMNIASINWEAMSPAPKFKNIVVNKFMSIDHTIDLVDLSPDIRDEKLKRKWARKFEIENPEFTGLLKAASGIPEMPQQNEMLPQDIEELEIFDRMGGFKTAAEAINKKVAYGNFHHSDWPEIKRKMLSDIFDMGVAGCKTYYDKDSGKVKVRYVDPCRAGYEYNRYNNSLKSNYYFEIVDYTVAELRTLTGAEEKDIEKIAKSFVGYNGNPAEWNSTYNAPPSPRDGQMGVQNYGYDSFVVPVLDFEVLSVDTNYHTKRTKPDGETRVYKEKFGKSYPHSNQRETITNKTLNLYQAKWIIGTDIMFDYGRKKDIPRRPNGEVVPSFYFYAIEGPSMIDLMRSDIDNVIYYSLKIQNLVQKTPGDNIAVDWGAMQGIQMNGTDAGPHDLMRIRRQGGPLIVNLTTQGTMRYGGGGLPVMTLPGGIGKHFEELIVLYDRAVQNMRALTGLNEVVDSTSPNPEVTRGQAVLAAQASNNALNSIYAAYLWLKSKSAYSMMHSTQLAVKYSKKTYDVYYSMAGKNAVEIISMTKDHTLKDLGIFVKIRATNEDRQETKQMLIQAYQSGQITASEYLFVKDYIDDGRTDDAIAFLAYREKQRAQQALEEKKAGAQEQGQQELQKLQLQSKIELEKEQQLSAIRIAEHEAMRQIDANYKIQEQDAESQNSIEEEAAKATLPNNSQKNTSK